MADKNTQNKLNNVTTPILLLLVVSLLAWASTQLGYESDWTNHNKNSLSPLSIDVLNNMQQPIHITAYASENLELRELIERFIKRYQKHKVDINVEFKNPLIVVEEARNLGIRVNGELIVEYQNRIEHVHTDSEEVFTHALQRLLKGEQRWVYFLEGHGERSPLGKDNHDYSIWAQELSAQGIRSQPFNLLKTSTVPHNAAVLVIASPVIELNGIEIKLIIEYLERGGNLLWLSEPGEKAKLDVLLQYFKLTKLAGVIVDASTQLLGISSPTIAVVANSNYPEHPVTKGFNLSTFFPLSAAYQLRPNPDWSIKPLLYTGELSWLERGSLDGEVIFDHTTDMKGPVMPGLSLERPRQEEKGQQRVVIIGDGDFLANSYNGTGGNHKLGLRLITWLSGDDDLVGISGSTKTDTELDLKNTTLGLIGLFYLVVLPGGCCVTGAIIWWRRRRL